MSGLETERCSLIEMNEEIFSYLWQANTSPGRFTDKLVEHIPHVYFRFSFNLEKAVLRYYNTEQSKQIQLMTKLRRNQKRKSEKAEEMRAFREDGASFGRSISLL